jgi:hypothetical protein
MTRASRPAYWKAVRAIARTLARHPELGAPQTRPSSVAGRIADLDGGAASDLDVLAAESRETTALVGAVSQ